MNKYKIVEQQQGNNQATTAGVTANIVDANDAVISGTKSVDQYNSLEAFNGESGIKITILLDGDPSRSYPLEALNGMILDADEGQYFKFIKYKNEHSADAMTADSCVFKLMKKILS